ncbi:hypothetical protein K493DRAFT_319169 [Basidiobolus meristosporus CBS 931.73]|uniref:Tetraspanin Tsp2 n=1 Tax=Basidiobolus meristosporus CBS 931.73 TaxID=1314790 RepID=A0A1Y1XU58_9FUNG|nr:hypothetical protein K493DRAFT_319169 [Basidiobolus meristosporus CBS 931.73]|eukprot:ORX88824.1 hypothetical protein K493DRAFT_319169 [Basidiobolus meristosporus CBS 931.73]
MYDSLNPMKIPKKPKKWTSFKWTLLFSNTVLMAMGIAGLVLSLLTWYKLYLRAEVVLIVTHGTIVLLTVVSSCAIAIAIMGYFGVFFNNRKILTLYCILLWPMMGGIASIGYVTYKFSRWHLASKLSSHWDTYSVEDIRHLQANMHCCGFNTVIDRPQITNKCDLSNTAAKMVGCRFKLTNFVAYYLKTAYITAFSLLIPHLFVLFSSLLCSNHITETFGTEPAPKLNYHQE